MCGRKPPSEVPLLSSLLIVALASAGTVRTDGTTLAALQPDPVVEEHVVDALVLSRSVRLTPTEQGTQVQAEWMVQVRGQEHHGFRLVDGSAYTTEVTVDGRVHEHGVGDQAVRALVSTGIHTITWTGWFAADASVSLLPAPAGTVQVSDPALTIADATVVGGAAWTGRQTLELTPKVTPIAETGTLVTATVGTGLSVEEDVTVVRSRVVFAVRRGEVGTVRIGASDVGRDLQVSGPRVASWEQQGGDVLVTLAESVRDSVQIELSWTTPSDGQVRVPRIEPRNVFRVQSSLQVSRPDDLGVRPELSGWRAVARSQIPAWGTGLVDGPPRLAYVSGGQATGSLSVERFEPIVGPAVIVDVADWSVATTQEGRALVRGFLEVRNERASHLRITLPPGFQLLSAQVGGQPVSAVREAGSWLFPLERSLETLEGLISFPIELALLGDERDWQRRDVRTVVLPTIGAPVQAARTSLVLPVGYRAIDAEEHPHHVDVFSSESGLTYGFGVGDVGAAAADRVFQSAMDAWMVNDFEEVERSLDTLNGMGASSQNIDRLESNLYAVTGRADDVDEAAYRRVREQAQARSLGQQRAYEATQKLAEEAEQRGDYSASSAYYEQALDLGQNLSLLEGDEVEVAVGNAVIEERIGQVARRREALEQASEDAGRWAGAVQSEGLPWEVSDEMPFEVEGEPWWLQISGDETVGVGAVGYGSGSGSFGMGVRGVGAGGGGGVAIEYHEATVYGFDAQPASARITDAVAVRRRGGFLGGLFGRRGKNMPSVDVSAASASLSVPVLGEVVLYERLLLPADVPFTIELSARTRRSL